MERWTYPIVGKDDYTGRIYVAAMTIFDSYERDLEGGIIEERIFDDEYEALEAYEEFCDDQLLHEELEVSAHRGFDMVAAMLFTREYQDGLWIDSEDPFDMTIQRSHFVEL